MTKQTNMADFEARRYERVRYKTLQQKCADLDLREQESLRYQIHGHKLIPYADVTYRLIRELNDGGVI